MSSSDAVASEKRACIWRARMVSKPCTSAVSLNWLCSGLLDAISNRRNWRDEGMYSL